MNPVRMSTFSCVISSWTAVFASAPLGAFESRLTSSTLMPPKAFGLSFMKVWIPRSTCWPNSAPTPVKGRTTPTFTVWADAPAVASTSDAAASARARPVLSGFITLLLRKPQRTAAAAVIWRKYGTGSRRLHVAGTDCRFVEVRRARPGPARGLRGSGHFRARDAAHPRALLDLLRAREPGPEGRRLLHGADRAPADADGARQGQEGTCPLQPLPASRQHDVRRSARQRRRILPLLVPRLDLPPRRQAAHDSDDGIGVRGHALRPGQPGLQHEEGRARRILSRLRVREPRGGRPDAARIPRRIEDCVRRHVRSRARWRSGDRAELLPRHPALELEDLPREPARRAAPFGDAP